MWRIKIFVKAWMAYPMLKRALKSADWLEVLHEKNCFQYAMEIVGLEAEKRRIKKLAEQEGLEYD